MNHIVNNLWLGSQRDADALVRENRENITAILNVRGPDAYRPPGRDQSAEHPGMAYKWIPAPDIGVISPVHTSQAILWLQEQTSNDKRILIHCMHGVSRSPAFLAAFMVKSGISPGLKEARATIASHRAVQPAEQMTDSTRPAVLISALTGLPNRQSYDRTEPSPFIAVAEIDLMKAFCDAFGHIAGDMLLKRLAKILVTLKLDVYHSDRNEFLCKGETSEELTAKLSQARELFRKPFQVYADGRIQTIEEAGFSFGVGATLDDPRAVLLGARKADSPNEYPEWLRRVIAASPSGKEW